MKKYAAEFIATFFLVFAGAGAIVADAYLSEVRVTGSFGILGIALAQALALGLGIAAIAHISGGHANPAVTIAFWITRRIRAKDVLGYILAQLGGAALAALLVKSVMPTEAVKFAGLGVPALAEAVTAQKGVVLEVILTFFLAFVIWGVAVDRRGPRAIAPLAIGLVLGFDILTGGPFTGAAMNPARWFGPALLGGQWANYWVWIVGPVLGALLGGLVYETLFLGEQPPSEMEEELLDEDEAGEDEEDLEPAMSRAYTPAAERPSMSQPPRPSEPPPPRPSEPPPPPPPPRPSEPPPPPPAPPRPETPVTPPRESPPVTPPRESPPVSPPGSPGGMPPQTGTRETPGSFGGSDEEKRP